MDKYIMGTVFLLIQLMIFVQGYEKLAQNYTKQSIVTIVETHTQMARMTGYFSPELKSSLLDKLSDLKRVDSTNITYELTETLVCTRTNFSTNDQIKYDIVIPIEQNNVKLFGKTEDILYYPQKGIVSSEKKCGEI